MNSERLLVVLTTFDGRFSTLVEKVRRAITDMNAMISGGSRAVPVTELNRIYERRAKLPDIVASDLEPEARRRIHSIEVARQLELLTAQTLNEKWLLYSVDTTDASFAVFVSEDGQGRFVAEWPPWIPEPRV